MEQKTGTKQTYLRAAVLAIAFVCSALIGYLLFGSDTQLANKTEAQQLLYPALGGILLGGLTTAILAAATAGRTAREERPVWYYPLMAALLTLAGLGIAYVYLGIWPVGEKSCMLVDMHHQYAPLLSKLREMLQNGESFLYSFRLGMGASVLPALAYYTASPLNALLLLFPETYLTEGIFVITLIKNMLIAAGCAVCLQYVYRRRTPAVVAVSLMYSMMMYVLAYSWNIMWLDGVIMLPLVVMGFEHLMRRGRWLPYVLSLAYALYANYYIAFMLCVFLVLYFVAYVLREPRTTRNLGHSFGRFAVGSLLGGGLAMFLVLPTALALGQTSAAGGSVPELTNNFEVLSLLGRQLYGVTPTIRSGNLPNQYCGVLAILLVGLFATNREIPRRRRAAYLGMLAVMALSMVLNQADLLWHGLHTPNDLPYRYSFIYSFVLLLIGYEALLKIRATTIHSLLGTLAVTVGYILLEERFGGSYDFVSLYVSMGLLVLYAALLWLWAHRRVATRVASLILVAVVALELTMNATRTITKLNNQEHYTAHTGYVDNVDSRAIRQAVEAMKQLSESDGAEGARMEFLPRRTCMDTALFDYPGITAFASSNSYRTTRLLAAMGYAANGVNSSMYRSFIPFTDSLLGIRYVALQSNLSTHRQLQQRQSVTQTEDDTTKTYYIYENTTALPLAYRVNSEVASWGSSYYDPITTVNSLYEAMTGDERPVLLTEPIEADNTFLKGTVSADGTGFTFKPSGKETATFTVETSEAGQYFAYVDCRSAKSASISQGTNNWSPSTGEPYFVDLGELAAGETVTVELTAESTCSGHVYVVRLDDEVFSQAMQTLSADGLQISRFSDTQIEGTIHASDDGVLMTAISYDAGWTVLVDGQKAETIALDTTVPSGSSDGAAGGALLGVVVSAGEHTVTFRFSPRGLVPGILLSVVSLLCLVLLVRFGGGHNNKVLNSKAVSWLFDGENLVENDLYAPARPTAPENEAASSESLPEGDSQAALQAEIPTQIPSNGPDLTNM